MHAMKKEKPQKEIWLLVDSSGFGGIESHILQLAKGLIEYGQAVRVVFMQDYPEHPLYAQLENQNIPFTACETYIVDLITLVTRCSPRLIHTHGYKAGIIGRLVAKTFSIACISTFHAGEKPQGRLALYDWLDRKSAHLAQHIFSVSEKISHRLNDKSQVINNFTNCKNIEISQGKQIAFVGRLSQEKGADHFIALAKNNPQHQFHIYGDGPEKDALLAISSSNVIFHGQQASMKNIWKNIGLLLITSRYEGLPMTAIEAMSRGIPVISYNVGSLHNLIEDSISGWLIEPQNLDQFQVQLNKAISLTPQDKKYIQHGAIQRIKDKFSFEAVIPQYIQTYDSVQPATKSAMESKFRSL